MSDSREVSMPEHLWEALDTMATEMGVDVHALVSQAVFTMARLNGYVVPGKVAPAASRGSGVASSPSRAVPGKPPPSSKSRPAARAPEPEPEPEPEPDPEPAADDYGSEEEGNPFEGQEQDDLPPEDDLPAEDEAPGSDEEYDEPAPVAPRAGPGAGKAQLTLFVTGRDAFRMAGDSFTIGRGKSCDFVIDSNRVSREHCRIGREGSGFVLEDLNSSNGTFFGPNKEKVTRRPIKDGDEFTLGTEKIRFQIRK
jgi:pSer/pThr/pTyr-binding forkhead associated (FHA) protein